MSRYYGGWAPYVPVAERRRKAEREMAKLRKGGHPVAPVTIAGRLIATTFWGKAWCDNIEGYHDYENRLPRGRTYVRNGSVVDLQITPGQVTAIVSGSALYKVTITIKETAKTAWRSICTDCTGSIDSMVELLQGRFSKGVMERLCRQQDGLFPRPSDIRFSCSCPDYASMCKHVAAVLYGVGARLDQQPELLFRLRAVNEADLLAGVNVAAMLPKAGPDAGRVLADDDVSALFGLDMDAPAAAAPEGPPRRKGAKETAARKTTPPPGDPEKAAKHRAATTAKPAPKRKATGAVTPAGSTAAGKQAAAVRTTTTGSSRPAKATSAGKTRESDAVRSAAEGKRAGMARKTKASASSRQARPASDVAAEPVSARARSRAGKADSGKAPRKAREPKPQPVKWW